ncbi:hypothetical protein SPRG_01233 [Saprolegnia parasitica CBS 223.65]|uniref:RING-type E3 ubiquitin transferase n=1 Tax=Saprolegnia parasitica (strain CBS 223.65) TaxID=695850 RepID=A0A067CXF6_SAPPC|nr:hypothetical protein SPRG_01233 [Saprolegnia parasitica CBS 223.65]KDO33955.1 hypothetical protein SPRG_01233 [Saprolegnia parasitica CBS 223.65]|eukprot:XP_012194848.1 hypothetical protein SPRG_01233 [Saprolegnia parasitica CBS 223.65]
MSGSTKRAVCTFHLQNACSKGSSCRFEHPARPPCKFFRDGKCSMGAACRFAHSSAGSEPSIIACSLPMDQRTDNSAPNPSSVKSQHNQSSVQSQPHQSSSIVSQPKSDSNRIMTGQINGHAFEVEILDPADVPSFTRRDYDEETDYSYVEPDSIDGPTEYDTFVSARNQFQEQLDDLARKMAALTDDGDETDSSLILHRPSIEHCDYSDIQPAAPPKQCKFHLQGACRFGDACIYSHARGLSPDEGMLMDKELHASQDVECNICMDLVLRAGERFGLLPNCVHAFCLKCIRDKDRDVLRQCPVCAADAPFIVPCNRFIADPTRKQKILADYKANLATIPCRHFNLGRGKCPFKHDCFYEHRFPDGKLAVRSGLEKPPLGRRLQSA